MCVCAYLCLQDIDLFIFFFKRQCKWLFHMRLSLSVKFLCLKHINLKCYTKIIRKNTSFISDNLRKCFFSMAAKVSWERERQWNRERQTDGQMVKHICDLNTKSLHLSLDIVFPVFCEPPSTTFKQEESIDHIISTINIRWYEAKLSWQSLDIKPRVTGFSWQYSSWPLSYTTTSPS